MKETTTHTLVWENQLTGKRYLAGVAFYSEEYDEYRLKIDCFSQNRFYLKTIGLYADKVHYRAEVVLKKRGQFVARKSIGVGLLTKETKNEVHIELGPFSNKLILKL